MALGRQGAMKLCADRIILLKIPNKTCIMHLYAFWHIVGEYNIKG